MIPTVEDLETDPLPARLGDWFNPPGLTNFLGTVQVDHDPVGFRSLGFPPLFTGSGPTARLFLDGEYVTGTGATTTYVWRPDRVRRTTDHAGLRITCDTTLAVGRTAVVQRITVENRSDARREVDLGLALEGWAVRTRDPIRAAAPPAAVNTAELDAGRGAYVFTDPQSHATYVQGVDADEVTAERGLLRTRAEVGPGGSWTVGFVGALGDDRAAAIGTYDDLVSDVAAVFDAARTEWDEELEAVVTPGNGRYSGHLPLLETSDDDLLRLYWNGILGVVYFKRDSPHSVVGRTYDTLMPRYWPTLTYLWDYSLSSVVHAMLDPDVMRRMLAHWMKTDVHTCMATEWLSGGGLGEWYAVNDYAMCRMIHDYARWTGDLAWLDTEVEAREGVSRPIDALVTHARTWQQFATANGLADYGGIGNLLECVSTYIHEVASMNAANVWCLRTAAEHLDRRGQGEEAAQLRKEADELATAVQDLYVEGAGHWAARMPDGREIGVRHCYDLATVLYAIPEDLGEDQRREMVEFFDQELRTDVWMRALSNRDPDAVFSVRADHQWNGAYCAWPSEVAAGLYAIGAETDLSGWLRGLARSANQGPFGQAHFAEMAMPAHAGGARKVSSDIPYINDWACSSGGSWVRLILEGVLGVKAGLDSLAASPRLDDFPADTRLRHLPYQGRLYTVDAEGIREETS